MTSYTQKRIQEAVDTEKFCELLKNQSPNREKARLQSLCLPQSGARLAAPPVPALGLHLSPSEFQFSVKYRLGIAVYEDERKFPYSRSGTLDVSGNHAVICHGRTDALSPQDRIRDRIAWACWAANLSPVIKKWNLIGGKSYRPGNIFLPSWKSGRPAALDVTVTSPLQPNIINYAAEKSGYAIDAAEEQKYAQHENSCSEQGNLFVPLAVESLGGLTVTLKKKLKRIALFSWKQELSVDRTCYRFWQIGSVVFRCDFTSIGYNVACTSPVTPSFVMLFGKFYFGQSLWTPGRMELF